MDSDKLDKPAHAKSYIVDTSQICAEYIFVKDGCSSFLIKCCLKNSWGPATAKLTTYGWVSEDPVDVRNDSQQGTHLQAVCSSKDSLA